MRRTRSRLLRPRRERPRRRRAAEERDELAALIIRSPRRRGRAASAARSRPSALAVFRLMTSSNLVGCSTGRSPASPRAESCRHSRRRAGTGRRSSLHRTSDRPLRRIPEYANIVGSRAPQRQGVDSNPVGGYERIANDIKCVRAALERLEGGRDILGSPDFECERLRGRACGPLPEPRPSPARRWDCRHWPRSPTGGDRGRPRAKVRVACRQDRSAGSTGR